VRKREKNGSHESGDRRDVDETGGGVVCIVFPIALALYRWEISMVL
jgi:hypothetical protein